jgi:hypothetical protein
MAPTKATKSLRAASAASAQCARPVFRNELTWCTWLARIRHHLSLPKHPERVIW